MWKKYDYCAREKIIFWLFMQLHHFARGHCDRKVGKMWEFLRLCLQGFHLLWWQWREMGAAWLLEGFKSTGSFPFTHGTVQQELHSQEPKIVNACRQQRVLLTKSWGAIYRARAYVGWLSAGWSYICAAAMLFFEQHDSFESLSKMLSYKLDNLLLDAPW